jgi:aminoglycoside phosphotransferase
MQCPQDELQIELAHYRENFKRGMGNEEWFVEERNKRSEVIIRKKNMASMGV